VDPLIASLLFTSGLALGISLDRWVLPALVNAWVGHLRRDDR
jgi:hypothetical protein